MLTPLPATAPIRLINLSSSSNSAATAQNTILELAGMGGESPVGPESL